MDRRGAPGSPLALNWREAACPAFRCLSHRFRTALASGSVILQRLKGPHLHFSSINPNLYCLRFQLRAKPAKLTEANDEATRRLMAELYRNWREEGMSKREALRQAEQALEVNPQFAAPRFWVPIVPYVAE